MQLRKPSLKPHVAWHRIGSEQIILCDRDREWLVSNRLYADVLQAVDGATTDEILERLSAAFEPYEILFAIHSLNVAGYLEEGLDALESRSEPGGERITISYLGIGSEIADIKERLLARGASIAERGEPLVVFAHDYLDPRLAEIDDRNWQVGRNWLLVRLHGSAAWIGPHFRPGSSICWQCLAQRMREAQWVKHVIRSRALSSSRPARVISSTSERAAALDVLTNQIASLARGCSIPANTLVSFDSSSMQINQHYVRGVTGCLKCGPATSRLDIERQSRMLQMLRSGSEDLRCFEHLISPLVGLISNVSDFETAEGTPARLVTAVQPVPEKRANSARSLTQRDFAFGKGYRRAQAVIGCIGEAIERYSVMQSGAVKIVASARELGSRAIDPGRLMNFSARQYRERVDLNAFHGGYNWIPLEFDPSERIGWISVVSMKDRRDCLVPAAYCYFGKKNRGRQFMRADTNGCASGNSVSDAQSRALFELIERDAAAIWWYNRLSRPAVNLESFANPMFADFQSWATRVGRSLRVLDITTDLGVPAYVAISARVSSGKCVAFGFGCHTDACHAVGQALVEMYQMCVLFEAAFESDARTDPIDARRRALMRWLREVTLDSQSFMEPSGSRSASDYDLSRSRRRQKSPDDLIELLAAHGLEAFWLELTRPDIGLPVVRALVPGLRHFWSRLAPGRLYDVPKSLGWLAKPHEERDLNPVPIFI